MQVDPFNQLQHYTEAVIGVMVVVVAALLRRAVKQQDAKNAQYDTHIEKCNDKAIQHARLEEQVKVIGLKVDSLDAGLRGMNTKLDTLLERRSLELADRLERALERRAEAAQS